MNLVLSWIFTIPFLVCFIGTLFTFHVLQMVTIHLHPWLYRKTLEGLNLFVLLSLRVAGTRFQIEKRTQLPHNQPLIIVSNHQSMFDIPLFLWHLRHCKPLFVAKKELGKGIPSVSFALRHMGSVLIDRKDPQSAVPMIEGLGTKAVQENYSVCIFPEGTRARTGEMKKFKSAGLLALLRSMPNAKILPVAIDNSWKLVKDNFLPVPFGLKIRFIVLPILDPANYSAETLANELETVIRQSLASS